MINFGRPPSKKEKKNFNKWVKYLSDSKLTEGKIFRRASDHASRGVKL